MKNMHLHSLMDETMTTVGVVFYPDDPSSYLHDSAPEPFDGTDVYGDDSEESVRYTGKKYIYKVPLDWDVQIDEKLVVPVNSGGKMIFRVATVARVDAAPEINPDANFAYRWAVCQVDFDEFECRRQREQDFNKAMLAVERTRKREELVNSFHDSLPEGSEARALFDRTIASIGASVSEVDSDEGSLDSGTETLGEL